MAGDSPVISSLCTACTNLDCSTILRDFSPRIDPKVDLPYRILNVFGERQFFMLLYRKAVGFERVLCDRMLSLIFWFCRRYESLTPYRSLVTPSH